jgi:site-specific DNA recombinase
MADKRAAIYTRVSSPGQATADAASLPEQERIARKLCEAQGWEIVEHYQDAGKSATKDDLANRPEMRRLLADAAAGRFSHVAVYHQDRLARNVEVSGYMAGALRRAGVTIRTERGPVDMEEFGGKVLYYVTALMAEEEGRRIRERCDRGKRGYAERGDFPQWMQPFGYRWEDGDLPRGVPSRLHPIPEELAIVREVFHLAGEGRTLKEIAAHLGQRGLMTRGRLPKGQRASKIGGAGGTQWSPSVVQRMLADPRYRGEWCVWKEGEQRWFARPELVPEVAVTPEEWAAAQASRKHHQKQTRRPMKHAFLLNGSITCARCGGGFAGHVTPYPDGESRYYAATHKLSNRECSCRGKYVPAEALEQEAWALVEELAEHPEMVAAYARATREEKLPADRKELARLDTQLASCDEEMDRTVAGYGRGEVTAEELARARVRVATDRAAWSERAEELRLQIASEDVQAHAAEQVANMAAEAVTALDLSGRRWWLAKLGLHMEIDAEDWTAKGPDRRYSVTIEWLGADLVGELSSTTDIVPRPNKAGTIAVAPITGRKVLVLEGLRAKVRWAA